jgi:hypothetical protein
MSDTAATALRGWIMPTAYQSDERQCREDLERIGVKVGQWANQEFINCVVSDEAFAALDPLWGNKYIWGLN